MGLVEISEKMTTSVTIPGTGSRSSTNNSTTDSSSVNTTPTSSTSPDQVVRKKRTFDVAFLTGQSEKESIGDNLDRDQDSSKSPINSLNSTTSNNNNIIERKSGVVTIENVERSPHGRVGGYNNLKEAEDGTNSDSSSIDVMTNGSLSESESQSHSPSSSIPDRPSPPLHPMLLIHHHHQQQQQQHLLNRANGPSPLYPNSNGNTSSGINHRGSSHNSSYDHHHQHHLHHGDIKSSRSSSPPKANTTSNKTRYNRSPIKEEIRFESRRIIDINQTVDSLKIKENLQFSTLLPSSAAFGLNLPSNGGHGGSEDSGGRNNGPSAGSPLGNTSSSSSATSNRTISVSTERTDLTLPHLASTIALLPHVARFPLGLPNLASGVIPGGNHMAAAAAAAAAAAGNLPFHAKMEKSESINISYPKVRGGAAFPDPYAALASAGGYPYPNLLGIPPELGRHPAFPNPLGSPGGNSMTSGGISGGGSGGSSGRGIGSPGSNGAGQQVSAQPPSQPPPPTPSNAPVSPCGISPPATLLPPSLTALTLPAQNVCAKCNIGFRMTSDLVYHMRSHHKRDTDPMKKQREEKLKCPVCHETFRERHHLTRHMTAHQDRAEET